MWTATIVLPKRSMSPSRSRRRPCTRSPLTYVPLRDSPSSITASSPARCSSSACSVDTDGSHAMLRSATGLRPTASSSRSARTAAASTRRRRRGRRRTGPPRAGRGRPPEARWRSSAWVRSARDRPSEASYPTAVGLSSERRPPPTATHKMRAHGGGRRVIRVLVIGAAGMIGRKLVQRLVGDGAIGDGEHRGAVPSRCRGRISGPGSRVRRRARGRVDRGRCRRA